MAEDGTLALEDRVTRCIRRVMGDEFVGHETFDAAGIESLDRVEIAMEVEQEFDLEIADADERAWGSGADVAAYLRRRLGL